MESVISLYPDWWRRNAYQLVHHMTRMLRDERSRDAYPLVDIILRMNLLPYIMAMLRHLSSPLECAVDALHIIEHIQRTYDNDVIRQLIDRDRRYFNAAVKCLMPLLTASPEEMFDDFDRLTQAMFHLVAQYYILQVSADSKARQLIIAFAGQAST